MSSKFHFVTEEGVPIKREASSLDFLAEPEAEWEPAEAVQGSHDWSVQAPAAHGSMLQYESWEPGHLTQNGSQDFGADRDRAVSTPGTLPSSSLPGSPSMRLPCRVMRQGLMAEEGVGTYPPGYMNHAGTGRMIKTEPMSDDGYLTPPQVPLPHPASDYVEARDLYAEDSQDSDDMADWEVVRCEWKRSRLQMYSIMNNILKCSHCGKECRSSEQLKTHILNMHMRLEGEKDNLGRARRGRRTRKHAGGRETRGISSKDEEVELSKWIYKSHGKHKCKTCSKQFTYKGSAWRHVLLSHNPGLSPRTSQGKASHKRVPLQGTHSKNIRTRRAGEKSSRKLPLRRAHGSNATVRREERNSSRGEGMDSSSEFSFQEAHSRGVRTRRGGANSSRESSPRKAVRREEVNSREDFSPESAPNKDATRRQGMDSSDVFSFQGDDSSGASPRGEAVNYSRVFFPVSLQSIQRDELDCPECRATFALQQHLHRHLERHHPGLELHTCPRCRASFTRVSHLQHHINQAHKRPEFICAACGTVFASLAERETHIHSCQKRRPEKTCHVCGRTFDRLLELQLHVTMEHGDVQRKAAAGGRSVFLPALQLQPGGSEGRPATQAALLQRQPDGSQNQHLKYPCPLCGKAFAGKTQWQLHQKVSHGYFPTKTSGQTSSQTSGQTSSQTSILGSSHTSSHTSNQTSSQIRSPGNSQTSSPIGSQKGRKRRRQRSSQGGQKKAKNRSVIARLLSHKAVPAGLRCPHCQKVCGSRTGLTSHMLVHKKSRHKCSKCGDSFLRKPLLAKHIEQAHRRTKGTCVCPECGKTYSRKDHLKEHIDTAHKGLLIRCPVCEKTYSRTTCLTRHVRKHHSEHPGTSQSELSDAL